MTHRQQITQKVISFLEDLIDKLKNDEIVLTYHDINIPEEGMCTIIINKNSKVFEHNVYELRGVNEYIEIREKHLINTKTKVLHQ